MTTKKKPKKKNPSSPKKKKSSSSKNSNHRKSNPSPKRRTKRRKSNPGFAGPVAAGVGVVAGALVGIGGAMLLTKTSLAPKTRAGALIGGGLVAGIGLSFVNEAIGAGVGAGLASIGAGSMLAAMADGATTPPAGTTTTTPGTKSLGPAGGRPAGLKGIETDLDGVWDALEDQDPVMGELADDLDDVADALENAGAIDGVYDDLDAALAVTPRPLTQ